MATTDGLLSNRPFAGASPQMGDVADPQCDSLRDPHGLSVAHAAPGFPTLADRVRLLLALDAERAVGTDQYRARQDCPATGWTQPPAQCRHYRQPERQDFGRGRSAGCGCP